MPSFSIRVEGVRDPAGPTLKSVYFPLIASGATLEETVEVRFPKRGAYRQNSFAFSTSSPSASSKNPRASPYATKR